MSEPSPRAVGAVLGFSVFVAILDLWLRFSPDDQFATLCNAGIAFGIDLPVWLLWGSSILLLGVALHGALWANRRLSRLAWAWVGIGGAVNTIDRASHGCVTDYLHLPFFPSFNLADMMLFLGIASLFVLLGKNESLKYAR